MPETRPFFLLLPALALCGLLFLGGCVTAPIEPLPKTAQAAHGTYHRVEKGETLWRISRAYDIDLGEIVKANRLPDNSVIEPGQIIFIPRKTGEATQNFMPISTEDFCWPVRGRVIAGYGQTADNTINRGLDIQAPEYSRIIASRSGKVVFCGTLAGRLGKTIIIDHGDGYSSLYARNSEVLVKPGDDVIKGTVIAKVGNAGRDKTKYLHFEIRKGYLPQNPGFYLS